jgi:energy-coupling factor transport system permease protein
VAMTLAPQMLADVTRVRRARRLRGRADRGVRAVVSVAMPVLEGALERSLRLAAAMDSRGYGRSTDRSPGARRLTAVLLLGGLLGLCLGIYGLLDGGSPPLLGLPALLLGGAAAAVGVASAGRRSVRTRYRPDPWTGAEWLVAGAGLGTGALLVAASLLDPAGVAPTASPLQWPPLPPLGVAAIGLALAPAWAGGRR